MGTVLRQENMFSEEHRRRWPAARAGPASQGGSASRLLLPACRPGIPNSYSFLCKLAPGPRCGPSHT